MAEESHGVFSGGYNQHLTLEGTQNLISNDRLGVHFARALSPRDSRGGLT